ncbi:bifunctional homocysteine S-methyltransferase/methylenetetrahydrofolate reductase [Staphylospora marina]|uniref:bifunctional homocysteine S-methyltransferase/methylenetetrahydrofolate reductase n=1 Tax=Staphylospora marina TaxID=2490858 RepID=UPI001F14D6A1|nr:bifunctional homocysteine S-methyltransferase/methylenetetrahydrofolate reductase [Staphylospora marina]
MATWLYRQGIPIGQCTEELVLTNPLWIRSVHRAYLEAGARVIQTHTYGANRERLTRFGLESKVTAIHREAVKIARDAAGDEAWVLGTVGSILAGRLAVFDEDAYRGMYEEQATALLHAGVDGILLETFLDVKEMMVALKAIRSLTDLPVIAQFSMLEVGMTRDAAPLSEAFRVLAEAGADGVGINCRLGPVETLRALEQTVIPEDVVISVYPNAGRLGIHDGEVRYDAEPEYFGKIADSLIRQGVRLMGGCCGTTPEHIRCLAEAVRGRRPVKRINPPGQPRTPVRVTPPEERRRKRPPITEKVKTGRTVICEWSPPRDLDISGFLKGAQKLSEAGADAITMSDNSLAVARMSNMALAAILRQKYDMDPLVHVTCRDRNLLGQQSHLMGLHALGIDQILVVTGDPARMGDLPGASSVYDVSSFELIRMVKQLNNGISFSGRELKEKARFIVGAAFNPHVRRLEAAVRRLEKKVEAGADFIMTQPVYDPALIREIRDATGHLGVPVFIGIMPLTGHRNALFLHHEVPGIRIPEAVLKRLQACRNKEEGRREGLAVAKELLKDAMECFSGIYLITPFSWWWMTEELIREIREKDRMRKAMRA